MKKIKLLLSSLFIVTIQLVGFAYGDVHYEIIALNEGYKNHDELSKSQNY